MLKLTKKGFSLIELLVVITILAIISVVAYTNFSWSTDKAKNAKKVSDLASIETALQAFFQEKNYFPMPSTFSSTNVWWYDSSKTATPTATFTWTKDGDQILSVLTGSIVWWWVVYKNDWSSQIWAKWVIDSSILPKQYLSTELLDPSLKDIKVWDNNTFKDYWIGKYIYWVYAKNSTFTPTDKKWSAYNIAATIKNEQDMYVAKIIWNFDSNTCSSCPDSLIWSWTTSIIDGTSTWVVIADNSNQVVPYPIDWF